MSYCTGAIGLLGTKPSWDLMMECDTLFMIGSGFPYSEFLPREGQARGVQIDVKARMLSLRYPMEVPLHGDAKLCLQALELMLQRKSDRSWRQRIENQVAQWWQVLEGRANLSAHPVNPQKVFWELSSRLPDNCIITCDSGSAANWLDSKGSSSMRRRRSNVPPLPPHINFEQARAYWSAIAKGDPDALGTITQSVKEMMESWLPRSGR